MISFVSLFFNISLLYFGSKMKLKGIIVKMNEMLKE